MDQTASETHVPSGPARARYDGDLYAWAMEQAEALRDGRVSDLDLPNLIDEVRSIAHEKERRLELLLGRLCHQMLLWDHGRLPRTLRRSRTIVHQRRRVGKVLARCPSLDDIKIEALEEGYRLGRYSALIEDETLPLRALPADNPYGWDDLMTRDVAWRVEDGGPA